MTATQTTTHNDEAFNCYEQQAAIKQVPRLLPKTKTSDSPVASYSFLSVFNGDNQPRRIRNAAIEQNRTSEEEDKNKKKLKEIFVWWRLYLCVRHNLIRRDAQRDKNFKFPKKLSTPPLITRLDFVSLNVVIC